MMLPLIIGTALAADPCQESLQSLQIADHGTVQAVVRLGTAQTDLMLQVLKPSRGHGVRAMGRYTHIQAFSGHHDDGSAWLTIFRAGQPIVAVNEHVLEADWSGGDSALLADIEPVVVALVFESMEHVGGRMESVGGAVLDWMYTECIRP